MDWIVFYSVVAAGFLALMLTEVFYAHEKGLRLHDWNDSLISLSLGMLGVVLRSFILLGPVMQFYLWLYAFAAVQMDHQWYVWFAAFWVNEFLYYWFHRWSHEIRFLWATHVNHHSSEYMNFFTAARTPFLNAVHHAVFWIPMPLLGFPADVILIIESLGFLFAFFQHTELVKKLGPLEWIINTPSHHRVHHGSNEKYLDKNYGGVTIVFDRIFGTFEEEIEKPVYGITKPLKSKNWFIVVFHEWFSLISEMASARYLKNKVRIFFGPVGSHRDNSEFQATDVKKPA